jgi:Fe-coproporphyrin III synthase
VSAPGPFDQLEKALAHRPHLEGILRGQLLPPVSVKIELTSVCNHDCHFCAYRRVVQDPKVKQSLPTPRALELVDELKAGGVQGAMFTGGGEPLAHPGAEAVLARCHERSLAAGLITNGTLLGRVGDEVVRGLRWVRFSINAADRDEYVRVHGATGDDWDKVWSQVARAKRLGGPEVGISFVVTTWNQSGLETAVRHARESGADYVHLRPAFSGPHTELDRQLSSNEIAENLARLATLAAFSDGRFRVYGVARRFREISEPPREHIHCRATPLVAYVLPDARVSICTVVRADDFNPRVADPFLGSLHGARFFDLWNTPKHHALMKALSGSGCARCHFAEYNRALSIVERDALHFAFL